MYPPTYACIFRITFARTRGGADGQRGPGRMRISDRIAGQFGVMMMMMCVGMGDIR